MEWILYFRVTFIANQNIIPTARWFHCEKIIIYSLIATCILEYAVFRSNYGITKTTQYVCIIKLWIYNWCARGMFNKTLTCPKSALVIQKIFFFGPSSTIVKFHGHTWIHTNEPRKFEQNSIFSKIYISIE